MVCESDWRRARRGSRSARVRGVAGGSCDRLLAADIGNWEAIAEARRAADAWASWRDAETDYDIRFSAVAYRSL